MTSSTLCTLQVDDSTACRVRRRIRYKHLIKSGHIPRTRQSVQGQIRRHCSTSLKGTTLNTTTPNVSLQTIRTSLHSKIGQANFEGVASSNRWRAYELLAKAY
jgi:hypothetical protein